MAPGPGKDTAMSETFQGSQDYVASEELMRAVNIAMVLQKPLLIKGEPGTGKTVLAEAIAKSLGKELIIWNIKSTTKAQDGLYVYDVVQRLYDSQFGGEGVDDIEKYVKLGKLGEAFTADDQVILLIDEIDKADLEFPNDLLWELDRMEFHIPETGRTVTAKHRPIVIITSNAEKELPDAFLRRCIFHYIAFPEQPMMEKIIKAHYPDLDQKLIDGVLDAWWKLASIFSGGMLGLFLLGVVCKTVRRAHAVVAVILGLLTIAWMSLSPLINEGSPFYRFHSPLHTYLTIVFGTTVIFLTGFLLTKLTKKEN